MSRLRDMTKRNLRSTYWGLEFKTTRDRRVSDAAHVAAAMVEALDTGNCPTCLAPSGEPCRTASGAKAKNPHKGRVV